MTDALQHIEALGKQVAMDANPQSYSAESAHYARQHQRALQAARDAWRRIKATRSIDDHRRILESLRAEIKTGIARNFLERAIDDVVKQTPRPAMRRDDPKLLPKANWQTKQRGTNEDEYEIYRTCANDGNGGDITRNHQPLLTYAEWLNA